MIVHALDNPQGSEGATATTVTRIATAMIEFLDIS